MRMKIGESFEQPASTYCKSNNVTTKLYQLKHKDY